MIVPDQSRSIIQEANLRNKNYMMVDAMLIEMSKIGALTESLVKVQTDLQKKVK